MKEENSNEQTVGWMCRFLEERERGRTENTDKQPSRKKTEDDKVEEEEEEEEAEVT